MPRIDTGSRNADGSVWSAQERRRDGTTTHAHSCRLAIILLTAFALALAACGGGPRSPHVARLGTNATNGSGSTTTTLPTSNPTQLVDDWAACMRRHGDPNQADPTVDANNDIDINWNPAVTGGIYGTYKGGQGNSGPGQYCRSYLAAAQTALGGNQQPPQSDPATVEKFSQCMRANGIPDFPDPVNGNLVFNLGASGDLNPKNPTFQRVSKLCSQKTGAQLPGSGGTTPPGVIKIDGAGPLPG
jgi:hypothetical protein